MAPRSLDLNNSNSLLYSVITQQIAASPQCRITFAEYMDLVLYHPHHGYYATNQVNIGTQGDFFTSPHLGTDFGDLLAEQFAQMWQVLDYPIPFTLVEMGAGQGLLVQDILRYLHRHYFDCFEALQYIIVEKSPALIAEQQQRLQPLVRSGGHLYWCTWDDLLPNSIVGCCFSNELVDAFPVHRVAIADGQLQEVYVTVNGETPFTEVLGELSTPQLADYFAFVDVQLPSEKYPDGYCTEVNLAALDWMHTVADRLQGGYVLTIDYGYPAVRYYNPARSHGTLQCYYQHARHSNPYIHIGHQDLTAHIDFTALERQGERYGLQPLGFTQQGLFLMALGLGDRLAALSDPTATETQTVMDILQRRDALHSLMNPLGLGNFGVLLQGKGLGEGTRQLKGFTVPSI